MTVGTNSCKMLLALWVLLAHPTTVQAQTAVDLELALAVDASGSVSAHRFHLQQQGYAAAFRHPDVLKAIRSGATQSIAVIMYQWTGPSLQIVSVPWHRIHDLTSAEAFAAAIAEAPRQLFGGGTSISGAIDFGVTLFAKSGYGSARRVIDISGDGINNRGRAVTQARDEAVRAGITINGLPILALEPSLDRYFQDYVIGGPGAFTIPAADFETFGEAIRRKLILEIASSARFSKSALLAVPLHRQGNWSINTNARRGVRPALSQ
jgi:Protein of unknown function (DUF1194)